MRIRSVSARGVDLALEQPLETSSGVLRSTALVLIDVETDEAVGRTYVRTYTPVALDPLTRLVTNLAPVLEGVDDDRVTDTLDRHFRLLGPQGLTGMAMAGIDMAVWDARARAAGVPLVTLLGGEPRPIPAYASLRTMAPAACAAEAEDALAAGFRAVKMKAGPDGLDAVRAAASATKRG